MTTKRFDLVVHQLLAAVHFGEAELAVAISLFAHLLDAVEIDTINGSRVGIEIGRHGQIDEEQAFVGVELSSKCFHLRSGQHDLIGGGSGHHQPNRGRGGEGRL